ncbi:hypothetical protein GQ457_14G013660 [Hibiscus cannabinus]
MPTSHNQTVDRTQLVLIHVIMTGYRFNVGEVKAEELAAACINDKGILAFPCLITALSRRVAVPADPNDKYMVEKHGWLRKEYMRKMDVADATPISVAMPTPANSPIHATSADPDEAGASAPAEAQPTPASLTVRQSKNKEPAEVPILALAPTLAKSIVADRTMPDSPARKKGKTPAGRTISRHAPSSPEEKEQMH